MKSMHDSSFNDRMCGWRWWMALCAVLAGFAGVVRWVAAGDGDIADVLSAAELDQVIAQSGTLDESVSTDYNGVLWDDGDWGECPSAEDVSHLPTDADTGVNAEVEPCPAP